MNTCLHNGPYHTLDCPQGENERLRKELETLRAECKRYREALEKIAFVRTKAVDDGKIVHELALIAREALEGR